MTLTKAELADILVDKVSNVTKNDAKEIVELFFEEIRSTLASGEEIKISGFGNFQLRDKPQRPVVILKPHEEVPITARRVVTFHASRNSKAWWNTTMTNNVDLKRSRKTLFHAGRVVRTVANQPLWFCAMAA